MLNMAGDGGGRWLVFRLGSASVKTPMGLRFGSRRRGVLSVPASALAFVAESTHWARLGVASLRSPPWAGYVGIGEGIITGLVWRQFWPRGRHCRRCAGARL